MSTVANRTKFYVSLPVKSLRARSSAVTEGPRDAACVWEYCITCCPVYL